MDNMAQKRMVFVIKNLYKVCNNRELLVICLYQEAALSHKKRTLN